MTAGGRIAKKKCRQIKFLIPEFDGRAVSGQASNLAVYPEIAYLENFLLGRVSLQSPADGHDSCLELQRLYRLDQVIVGATFGRLNDVACFITHRHEDDREMPIDMLTYPFQDYIAVDIGKHPIKQQQIKTVAGNVFR